VNHYQYVPNPIGWVDPLGLTAQKESAARQLSAVASPQRQTMPPATPNSRNIPDDYDIISDSYLGSKFYSTPSPNGGSVHVSTGPITQGDFARIADNYHGTVDILTGTHGDAEGNLYPHRAFYDEDLERWGGKQNINVHDVTTMDKVQVRHVMDNKDTTICAWCYSEKTKF